MSDSMIDFASIEAPAEDSSTPDVSTSVDTTTPSAETSTIETADTTDSAEGKETETHNQDGSEKSAEQVAEFKAKASAGTAQTPVQVRNALKSLRDSNPSDPATQQAVKQLHGAFERYEALKPMLGSGAGGGINGLKSVLAAVGAKDVAGLSEHVVKMHQSLQNVSATDEMLYAADPKLWDAIADDVTNAGHPEALGKLADSFLERLATHDPESHVRVSTGVTLDVLNKVGFVDALNAAFANLESNPASAKASLQAIGKWFNELRDSKSEAAKISEERAEWEKTRAEGDAKTAAAERTKVENGIAEECDSNNNKRLGKSFGAYLRMPYFRDFPYDTKVLIGNQIKNNLYAALKADNTYQSQMSAMWKQKTPDRAKMVSYHQAALESKADDIVRSTIQKLYPGYAKGGSAAGKAAAASAKAATVKASAQQSIASGKPIYVAAKPQNLVRQDVTIGGKQYTASDLTTLEIMGRGLIRTGDGKGYKLITWRK